MSNKLLIISGPTATGKTDLAVKVAQKYNGELISADSRQIYKYLDIGVGKDHPVDTPIHLIDLVTPDLSFSVAQFRKLALAKIKEIQNKNKLPILVGCSGFYIDSVINSHYNTFSVKPNFILRKILFKMPTNLLQLILKLIDKKTYQNLNNSDLHNPLRLVRKIEIKISGNTKPNFNKNSFNILHLSLFAPKKYLYQKIDKRVEKRLEDGFIKELRYVLKKFKWSDPGLKISAYQVFNSDLAIEEKIQKWKYREHRDARRQLTWFNKVKVNHRLDISRKSYPQNAFRIISQWYNKL